MYYSFFGLKQPPFKITPDTDFFFEGGNRGAVLEALIYAVTHGEGIVKVTGEVGSGKTMLCRVLQARLPKSVEAVYLANPSVSPEEILHAIAFELQLPIARDAGRLVVMHALNEYLLARHAEGRQVVIFLEESQSMPLATLEEIRLLSNLETKQHKLLQIVLFGQPELDENLGKAQIRQLRERITHSFSLGPLRSEEVQAYVAFRLRAAGYHGPDLFAPSVVRYMTQATAGLTRRINIVADKALLAAFAENTHNVTSKHVRAAVHDSEFSSRAARQGRRGWLAPTAAFLLGALAVAGLYLAYNHLAGSAAVRLPGSNVAAARPPASEPQPMKPMTSSTPQNDQPAAAEPSYSPPVQAIQTPATQGSGASAPGSPPALASEAIGDPDRLKLSPGLSPQSDLLEQRLLATERWLTEAQGATFSIQLLGSNDPALLRNYFETLGKYIELEKVFVYRTLANQQPSMTVLYGAFGKRADAVKSLEALPDELKVNRPYIRTVQGIRSEIGLRKPS
ncbi:MAG TPA: AAA family ATPase [Burkholderiales bacterium]|nr:AAA family ATPase [Burkholderiales bacterium]